MHKYTIIGLVIISLFVGVSTAFAKTNCYSNSIIQGWINERDTAAKIVLQQWANGVPIEDMTSNVAVIFTNEVYTRSMCRDSLQFLQSHLIIPDKDCDLQMETMPSHILNYFLGFDILVPYILPETPKTGVKK